MAPGSSGEDGGRDRTTGLPRSRPIQPRTISGVLGSLLTAIVTPFTQEGAVDVARFRALASYLVDHGSDGVVVE